MSVAERGDSSGPPEPPTGSDENVRQRFFEEVLVDFILRCEEGAPPDIDAYLARYPRYAEDLAVLLSQHSAPPVVTSAPSSAARERARGWPMRSVGDYEILFRVSTAGAGRVFKARHTPTGRLVALKIMSAKESFDAREFERFRREAKMLADLEMPGVIDVLEVGQNGEAAYMTMPWIDGATIQEAIQMLRGETRSAPIDALALTVEKRAALIATTARTLATLHEKAILHRDIKPSNIMLGGDLEPMLIDFGIARSGEMGRLTRTHDQPLGTPRYLAPELLMGDAKVGDRASDIYALGVTLYEFLTLAPPFDGKDRRTLFEQIARGTTVSPDRVNPEVSPALAAVALKAMARDPRVRYPTAAALADAIEAASGKGAAPPAPFGASRRSALRWFIRLLLVAAIALALVSLVRSLV